MENCIFCRIAKGEIDCAKIWEDKDFIAFLDKNPNTKGMTLVITKAHFDSYAFNMPDAAYSGLMIASKKVAKILEKGLGVKRVAIVIEGMGLNHVHIKLYPMHGLKSEYEDLIAEERVFFDKYPSYITTLLGPEAELPELNKIADGIRKKANIR